MADLAAHREIGTDALSTTAVAETVRGLGGVAYSWAASSDRLIWSAGAMELLGPERAGCTERGRDYDALIAPGSGLDRAAAALASDSAGIRPGTRLFETVYCLVSPRDESPRRLWVEDRGVGYFDETGRLLRVDGMVRRLAVGRPVRGSGVPGEAEPQPERQRLARLLDARLGDAFLTGEEFGFLLFGIDHLGRLNDSYGFQVGDEVLDIVWMRLRAQLAPGEEMARFSGSKFGIVLPAVAADGLAAAHRFLASVNATPPRTSAGAVAVNVSAGGLIVPRHARSVAEIFSHAQDALHNARTMARGSLEVYTPGADKTIERRANLRFADDIVSAISERRVALAFQPIARSGTRDIAFHEALVRIHGHDGRVYDGATIMPAAERFGLTRLIDRRSMELSLAALREDSALRLSVNVSPASIHDGIWQRILEEGAREGLCGRLIVELTEAASISDLETMRRRVSWLHDLGCRVAMDDFGVGHTSFRSLRRLGIDLLKIDGSFICSLMESGEDRHFVRALLELASNLDIETVAEWVLDEETGRQLTEWGCTYLQGQLIGLAGARPRPEATVAV